MGEVEHLRAKILTDDRNEVAALGLLCVILERLTEAVEAIVEQRREHPVSIGLEVGATRKRGEQAMADVTLRDDEEVDVTPKTRDSQGNVTNYQAVDAAVTSGDESVLTVRANGDGTFTLVTVGGVSDSVTVTASGSDEAGNPLTGGTLSVAIGASAPVSEGFDIGTPRPRTPNAPTP